MGPNEPQVSFESEELRPVAPAAPQSPALLRWIIRYSGGYVKNETQATYVLVGTAALMLLLAAVIFFVGGSTHYTPRQYQQAPPGWTP